MIFFPLGADEIASTIQGIFQQEEISRFLNQNPPVKICKFFSLRVTA